MTHRYYEYYDCSGSTVLLKVSPIVNAPVFYSQKLAQSIDSGSHDLRRATTSAADCAEVRRAGGNGRQGMSRGADS